MDCKDKTILVTGATSGIGKACVKRLIEAGARVVGIGRDEQRLEQLRAEFGEKCEAIGFDLSDVERFPDLVGRLPAVDGLVMSAGINKINPIKYFNRSKFDETLSVNLVSPLILAVEISNAKKLKDHGAIVFLSSITGTSMGMKGQLAYATTKAGLVGATLVLAAELAGRGIRVNCVAPGMVATEMAMRTEDVLSLDAVDADKKKYPLGKRYAEPREVADLITYLVSNASSFVTGQTITIDGGRTFS